MSAAPTCMECGTRHMTVQRRSGPADVVPLRCGVTPAWCPACPICGGAGLRIPDMLALDCTCTACGWHYTSARSRSLLRALTRRRVEECEP